MALQEPNDTTTTAIDTGLTLDRAGTFQTSGTIGDNPNVRDRLDVDLYEVQLRAGDRAIFDIDAEDIGSDLDSVLRLFDASGGELAVNDDAPTSGESASRDSSIAFSPTTSGTYYLGVGSFNNFSYNPSVAGSGSSDAQAGATGRYDLNINVSSPISREGTPGNDSLVGGDSPDTFFGLAGNDTLRGFAENDTLRGGNGLDQIFGGAGNDFIRGGRGSDSLFGETENDNIAGQDGNDTINGGDGSDTLFGGLGDDDITGGSTTATDRDRLSGGEGNDRLTGGNNSDTLRGGNGNDTLDAGGRSSSEGFSNDLFGENGNDRLDGSAGVDLLNGGNDNDTIEGNAGGDRIDGGNGIDFLLGSSGSDALVGGGGNDTLVGALTTGTARFDLDTLTGGTQRDTFVLADANRVYYSGNSDGEAYGLITDFNASEDVIQLQGGAELYRLDFTTSSSGTRDAVIYAPGVADPNNIIGIVQNANTNLSLTSSAFTYV
jgi:Ca2+-binding RTX toxin-like protein